MCSTKRGLSQLQVTPGQAAKLRPRPAGAAWLRRMPLPPTLSQLMLLQGLQGGVRCALPLGLPNRHMLGLAGADCLLVMLLLLLSEKASAAHA